MLENFTWKTFENTGNIHAYLLYKEMEKFNVSRQEEDHSAEPKMPVDL